MRNKAILRLFAAASPQTARLSSPHPSTSLPLPSRFLNSLNLGALSWLKLTRLEFHLCNFRTAYNSFTVGYHRITGIMQSVRMFQQVVHAAGSPGTNINTSHHLATAQLSQCHGPGSLPIRAGNPQSWTSVGVFKRERSMTGMSVTSVRSGLCLHAGSQLVSAAQFRNCSLGMTMARSGNNNAGGKGRLTASASGSRGNIQSFISRVKDLTTLIKLLQAVNISTT